MAKLIVKCPPSSKTGFISQDHKVAVVGNCNFSGKPIKSFLQRNFLLKIEKVLEQAFEASAK